MPSSYSIAALSSQSPLHSSEDLSKSTKPAPKFLGRMSTRSLSFSSTSSSWSSSSLSDPESETEPDADQRRSALLRRNKILPPPTLSPILMPTVSIPDASPIPIRPKSPSALSVGSLIDDNSSSCSFSDGEEDVFTNSWPKLDKASIQDLCYRTSPSDSHSQSLSELPPPSSLLSLQHHRDEMTPNRKYLTLSASIWGPGWHQVEPLPPSFVKTLQQSELEAQAQAQALAQEKEKATQAAMSPKAKARKAKQQAKVAAAAAAAATGTDESSVSTPTTIDKNSFSMETKPPGSIMNTLCSARLPRSLQFVD
ncbi:hypothetical protein BG011_003697 [Mortierella polycephala]|uniref:Uncharacterized protein n=1 Tax=Mortierella polycephala TaxID=41804 RepID=A0A9P6U3Q2_9FUNG|nr:hypothetical protein BG011_003697 [Mortierella polycephala]